MSAVIIEKAGQLALGEVYVSDREGRDDTGDGTQEKPFKTVLQRWETISKTQFKNVRKLWQREQQKSEAREKKEAEDLLRREKNLEEAKKIVIKEDPNLPAAKC
ncbi:Asparagine--tRNA ligase, cytoplasmic, partial [Varanus komodoensis]